MNWSDVVGKRLALILIADELDDSTGGILYGVVRADGDDFLLDRGAGVTPFPLQPEWGNRVKLLSDVSHEDTLRLIGDVDCFVMLSVGLKGALIPIVALTRRFPLAPFGWSGTRGPFP